MVRCVAAAFALSVLAVAAPRMATGQGRPDPAALIAAQQEAMARLTAMDGVWTGPAWTLLPSGEKHELTQTERIGPFLDGSVKVIEGRGYEHDGSLAFNAFGVISFDPSSGMYSLRSHAMGQAGDSTFTPTEDGYQWEIPAGPMTIRYTAVIRDGTLSEVGDRIMGDGTAVRFFEMNLTRTGDTDWPAAGAVSPR